jgi:hypothetical protein
VCAPIGTLVLSHGCLPHSASGLHLGQGGSAAERWPGILPWQLPTHYPAERRLQTWARILATRFGYALQPCIGPHQTAFLQGRAIEDSIFVAELPCCALAAEQLPEQR